MTTHYWLVKKFRSGEIGILMDSNKSSAFPDTKGAIVVEADIRTSDAKILELAKAQFNSK